MTSTTHSWLLPPTTFTESNSSCVINTYKEGLLSAVAHDLKIALTRFEIKVDQNLQITARFWPDTFNVLGAVDTDNNLLSNVLKDKDLKQIKKTVQKEILMTHKYPVIQFQGAIESEKISGELDLKNKKHTVQSCIHINKTDFAQSISIRFEIQPSQWGIAPYKALFGAIRLKDYVVIQWNTL